MRYLSKKDIGEDIIIDTLLKFKKTARYSTKYLGHDDNNRKYIIECANLPVQKFYINRALIGEKLFEDTGITGIIINKAYLNQETGNEKYAVYRLVEGNPVDRKWSPDNILLQFYSSKSVKKIVDEELINQIIQNFLDAWPQTIHDQIRNLPSFELYIDTLKKYNILELILEHGDFTPNNILLTNEGHFILLDFEFVKCMQPIGFDMYDYHTASDKNYDSVPYLDLNRAKYQLIIEINNLLDNQCKPQIYVANNEFIKENSFVFNRFDIIHDKDFKVYRIEEQGNYFNIPYYSEGKHAEIGVWKAPLSEWAFNLLIVKIFKDNKNITDIKIRYSLNQFRTCLSKTNHLYIDLKESETCILTRMKKKARYNLNRSELHLSELVEGLHFNEYVPENVPDAIMTNYFKWKQTTHGTDYGLNIDEFILKYHISNIYSLQGNGGQDIAVLFTCEQCSDVYLENLSYDSKYSKFSPGMILYVHTLQKLFDKGKKNIYLGNGNQPYKLHFNSINEVAYSGKIYRIETLKGVGKLFSCMHNFFLKLKHKYIKYS